MSAHIPCSSSAAFQRVRDDLVIVIVTQHRVQGEVIASRLVFSPKRRLTSCTSVSSTTTFVRTIRPSADSARYTVMCITVPCTSAASVSVD